MDLGQVVPKELADPRAIVDALADQLLDGELATEARADLAQLLVSNEQGPQPETFRNDPGFREQQVRQALGLLLSLPEYHTC